MSRTASRLVVRLALIAASIAWAGFVFTSTVGDPGRGERIATAVLADDDARAEVVAPIASTVVRTAGIPPTQQPAVARQVDALMQDPASARSFIDPFAGQWARMLGDDVAGRPTGFDVGPLLDDILAATPGFEQVAEQDLGELVGDPDAPSTASGDGTVVAGVPLPQARLGWLLPSRQTVQRATTIFATLAAIGVLVGFAIGSRRWILRRVGVWAAFAGSIWVIVPLAVVWAARRWATGADSIIRVAVDEAVSGLRPVALVLVIGGVLSFASSFAPAPAWAMSSPRADAQPPPAARPPRDSRTTPQPAPRPTASRPARVAPVGGAPPRREPTATMPVVARSADETPVRAPDDRDLVGHDPLWSYYS